MGIPFLTATLLAFVVHVPASHHHRLHPAHRHRWGPWQTAIASWYGPEDSGGPLACGGGDLTSSTLGVAHKTLACGTPVRMCAQSCLTVRVVDRGPYVPGREWDLTEATARRTGFIAEGVGPVRYRLPRG